MKKLIFPFILLLSFPVFSQNFQVNYDFGPSRNYVTTTFEMFKPDKLGNTFIFVDFDFNFASKTTKDGNYYNPSLAYMEVARCFKLSENLPISAQIEYNGGLLASGNNAFAINNAFLAGLDYSWSNADYSKNLSIKALYKYIMGKHPASFQITGVWALNFLKGKLSFNGFADFWYEKNTNFYSIKGWEAKPLFLPESSNFVFIAEPQLWYNILPQVAVGTEIELSTNFGTVQGFNICPTLGCKFTF